MNKRPRASIVTVVVGAAILLFLAGAYSGVAIRPKPAIASPTAYDAPGKSPSKDLVDWLRAEIAFNERQAELEGQIYDVVQKEADAKGMTPERLEQIQNAARDIFSYKMEVLTCRKRLGDKTTDKDADKLQVWLHQEKARKVPVAACSAPVSYPAIFSQAEAAESALVVAKAHDDATGKAITDSCHQRGMNEEQTFDELMRQNPKWETSTAEDEVKRTHVTLVGVTYRLPDPVEVYAATNGAIGDAAMNRAMTDLAAAWTTLLIKAEWQTDRDTGTGSFQTDLAFQKHCEAEAGLASNWGN
jgi:hypothetical protein